MMQINIISREKISNPPPIVDLTYKFQISQTDYDYILNNKNNLFITGGGYEGYLSEIEYGENEYPDWWNLSIQGGLYFLIFSCLDDRSFIFEPLDNISFILSDSTAIDFIITPNLSSGILYSLNRELYSMSTLAQNTYFQFNYNLKVYSVLQQLSFVEYNIKNKLVPFKGHASIEIGETIQKLIDRFSSIYNNYFLFKPAEVIVSVSEIKISDNSLLREQTLPTIYYLPGLKKSFLEAGFLQPSAKPESVTINSFKFLNFYVPNNLYHLKIFKNNVYLETLLFENNNVGVVCFKVLFDTFNQGDKIEYVFDLISNSATEDSYNPNAQIKTFYMLPTQNYSKTIVWENIFLVQSVIEMRGDYVLYSDFEQKNFKKFENFVEKLEVLSTSKEAKIKINTGWIIQSDVDLIESLITSKKAWIKAESGDIEIIPSSKSIVSIDNTRDLIEFNLEFIINKKYNEENYSL